MRTFWGYLGGTIGRPRETFAALLEDPRRYHHSLNLLISLLVPYSSVAFVWLAIGAVPFMPVFLRIPEQDYYLWECLLGLPMFLLPMIMVAGTIHLLSRAFRGENTLEGFLPPFLFSLLLPFFLWAIHDLTYVTLNLTGILPPAQMVEMIRQPGLLMFLCIGVNVVSLTWNFVLVTLAIQAGYGLSRGKALFVCVVSVPWFHLWMHLFFR